MKAGREMLPCPHPAQQVKCPPCLVALTELVGEWQHEGGLLHGAFQRASVAGASLGSLPVRLRSRQVAELPSGVAGAPALIPANAAASIQARDLAEIYDINQGDQ